MACLDQNELLAYANDTLAADQRAGIEQHVADCASCRQRLIAVPANPDVPGNRLSSGGSAEAGAEDLGAAATLPSCPPSEPAPPLAHPLLGPGVTVDHFEIVRLVGRGGMGEVYLARDVKLGRKVALKVVRRESLGSQPAIDRFLLEARTTAQFNHPHIVTIHAVGEYKGCPYMALEYVEGQTLRQRMDRGLPDLQEALRIGLSIAEALAEAHKHHVLHRDLKPQNVVQAQDGRLRVLDFGLAKIQTSPGALGALEHSLPAQVPEALAASVPGLRGTPSHMAPEQWREQECSPATDVWALGLLLYELVSGRLPYSLPSTGSPLALGIQVTSPEPVPAVRIAEPGHDDLAGLIAGCLQKDPTKRPTAHQVAADLKRLLGTERVARPTPSNGRRLATVLLSYAGVSFSALQCVDLAVNRYVLSPRLVDLCVYLIFLLLPTTLLLGSLPEGKSQGRLRWVKPLGIAANLILAAVILTLGFRGKDLGSATRRVQVSAEDGKTVQRTVVKNEFIKRVAIFFFDNDTGDKDLNWLQLAIPDLLDLDLDQDSFLSTVEGSQFSEQLKKAGLDEYGREPLGLKQAIARDMHLDYFLAGSFTKESDDYVVRYALYKTQRGQGIAEHTVRGPNLLSLVDEITVQLKRDLGVPTHHIETVTDLPVADISSSSMPALRDYVLGANAWWFHGDGQTAKQLLARAAAKDPSFALAYYQSAQVYASGFEMRPAKEALQGAKQNEYRLCERQRFDLNWMLWVYAQAPDRQAAVLQQWTTLYPADTQAWGRFLFYYMNQGRTDDAIAICQKLLLLDPEDDEQQLTLGRLYRDAGDTGQALAVFAAFVAHFPSDARGPAELADLYRDIGEYEKARSFYQKVLAIDPDNLVGLLGECRVDLQLGNFETALLCLQRTLSRNTTVSVRDKVYWALWQYYGYRGMWRKALESSQLGMAERQKNARRPAPVERLWTLTGHLYLGQTGEAQALLTDAENSARPEDGPGIVVVRAWRIYYYVHTGDAASAASLLKETDALVSSYGVGKHRLRLKYLQGELHELTGEYQRALQIYAQLPKVSATWTQAELLAHIGRCHRQLDQGNEAEASLKEGLVLEPSQPLLHYELALVYQQLGRLPEAREHVQAALRVWSDADPEFDTAQKARALAASLSAAK